MSLQDDLFLADAYYVREDESNTGPQTDEEIRNARLPWKIEWDPSLGSNDRSREIIRIDMNADSVSGEDPATGERFYNPTVSNGVVPLRHSLFSAAPGQNINIWVLRDNATSWSAMDNAVGIEGVDAEARFFVRRDIPLSGDEGFTVGRQLFLGNAPFEWGNVTHMRIEVLYIGDYVQQKSFRQDLHEEANVVHRTLQVDLDSSSQFSNDYQHTARHSYIYKDIESPFIKGNDKESDGHSSAVLGETELERLHISRPDFRFGIHETVYYEIDPESIGQSHAGQWPSGADYYQIDSASHTAPEQNFILSYLQHPREDETSSVDEHGREISLQYDGEEMTWQIGGAYDAFRREYTSSYKPTLTRRYPSIARFVQGRTSATNQGFVDTSNPPVRSLNESSGHATLVTTWPGDPTLLQAHPDISFEAGEDGSLFFQGLTALRLNAPERPGAAGRYIEWILDDEESELFIGNSGEGRQQRATTIYDLAPSRTSNNSARLRWQVDNSDAAAGTFSLALDPVSASGVYGGSGYHDVIRFGLTGQGTTASIRNMYIGPQDESDQSYIEVTREQNNTSAFDVVFAPQVVPRVRGNMRIEGMLDTFSDISLGRSQDGSSGDWETLDRPALINGVASDDYLSLGRATDGKIDLRGSVLNYRRLFGPTIARLDLQMRRMLGYEEGSIPTFNRETFRDYTPHRYEEYIETSKDVIDEDTKVTLRSSYSGKVDAYDQRHIQYDYDGGNVEKNDLTDYIVDGIPYVDGDQVLSGFPRGQLHKEGYTARGLIGDVGLPVTITDRGIPLGEDHEGHPEHALNSSDMYLDADGEWRYLFDKVYLPVETN